LAQLLTNHNFMTWKNIYHPEDSAGEIASDVGSFGLKQIPQAAPMVTGGGDSWAARQLDITTKTPEQEKAAATAAKLRERNWRVRERKRRQGTYTP
jgi:hypothetical protein